MAFECTDKSNDGYLRNVGAVACAHYLLVRVWSGRCRCGCATFWFGIRQCQFWWLLAFGQEVNDTAQLSDGLNVRIRGVDGSEMQMFQSDNYLKE